MSLRGVLVAAVILAGIAARVVALDRLPGINGDEAWYAVNAAEFAAGNPAFLQTPSGNVVNPVHSLPLLLLTLVTSPSFIVLRVPEVCWGILVMLLAYPLLARPLGPRAALWATLLFAVTPLAVETSRLGWDPSGGPIATLLALGFALRDRPVLALIFVLIAYIVHPTTIFVFPTVVAAWLPHALRRYRAAAPAARRRLLVGGAVIAAVLIPVGAAAVVSIARMGRLPPIEIVAARVASPAAWLDTVLSVVRLLSGVTTTVYLAGPLPRALVLAADVVAIAALTAAAFLALRRARSRSPWAGSWLAAGLVGSIVLLHLVAGPVALEPGLERYAVSLIVPLVVLSAVTIAALLDAPSVRAATGQPDASPAPRARVQANAGAVLAAAVMTMAVIVVAAGYFYPLATRGGDAHETFRTGIVEPKAAAYDAVMADSAGAEVVVIHAEDWWLYWPIRYLALSARGRVFVELIGHTPPLYPEGISPPAYPQPPDKVYAVVFDGRAPWLELRGMGRLVFTATDPIGRPILHVIELPPQARQVAASLQGGR